MNLLAEAPLWIGGLLAAVLTLAAIQDAAQLRISNLFPMGLILLGALAMILSGLRVDYWQNLLVFTLLIGFGTMLFAAGKMGGGDVKLFAAIGLWVDLTGALTLIASIFIAGGVLALLLITARTMVPAQVGESVKIMQKRAGIPYGVAIAAGAMIAATLARS